MANPNIFDVSSIYGKTDGYDLTTTNDTTLSNSVGSNKVYKVNAIIISNYTNNDSYLTMEINKNATPFYLAYSVTVPGRSTLILVNKDTSLYLEEGMQIKGQASTANTLKCIVSYDVLS